MNLPPVNNRIRELIKKEAGGSVKKFSEIIDLASSQKLNRIFNIDNRNGKYPEPSYDIVTAIANKYPEKLTWLLTGKEQTECPGFEQGDNPGSRSIEPDILEYNREIITHYRDMYKDSSKNYNTLVDKYDHLVDKYNQLAELTNEKLSNRFAG